MLFTQKYAPAKIDEIAGNEEARQHVKQWMLNWIAGRKRKPLLVWGPPGIGKSSIAYALKNEFDLELVEMNASEFRDKERIERILSGATLAGSLSGKTKLLFIDDCDVFYRSDHGGITAITRLLKSADCPVLLTATNAWEKKISSIRMECELVPMKKVNSSTIKIVMKKVIGKENMQIDDRRMTEIADNASGDVRSALNDLQANNTFPRDREKDIFDRIRTIFKASTYEDAKKAVSGDVDYDLVKLWIDENIANEYETPEDIANAYYYLSRADQFEGRIRNSYWAYLRYTLDLMSAGVALAKKQPYRKFTKYAFPNYLREMARSVERRAMLKSIGLKIGKIVHCNYRDARIYLPILKPVLEKNEHAAEHYGFNEDEVAFIMETTAVRVKNGETKISKSKEKKIASSQSKL